MITMSQALPNISTIVSPLMLGDVPVIGVIYDAKVAPPGVFAASELAAYLERAMDTVLPVTAGEPTPGCFFVTTHERLAANHHSYLWKQTGYDRAVAISNQGVLYLVGENSRAMLYAVYDFLQEFLGIRFFGPGPTHEIIPAQSSLVLPFDLVYESGSAFEWRDYFARSIETVDFTFKNRINCYVTPGEQEEYGPIHAAIHARCGLMRGPGHLWRRFLPDRELFDAQPELFPLIEGVRKVTGQGACFSNPAVRTILKDKLRKYIQAHPFWDIFALWAEDAYYPHYCGCEQCATKTTGEWYMTLVNDIAQVVDEELPSHLFEFAAYHETRWPTLGVDHLYKNGATMLADLSLGYTRDLFSPLAACRGGSEEVMQMYRAWREYLAKLGYQGRLLMVDYYNWCEVPNMSPAGRSLLWPMEVIREDAQYYAAQGIQAVSDWVCFDALCWPTPFNLWAWFRIWQNPMVSIEALKEQFYPAYFNEAGPILREYMDRLNAIMQATISKDSLPQVQALETMLLSVDRSIVDPVVKRRIAVVRSHHAFAVLHLQIWEAFAAGDRETWTRLEAPYRVFFEETYHDLLTGEIDIPANWPCMWYEFYVKQGDVGIQRLLIDGAFAQA
jgi:hypothetical protein